LKALVSFMSTPQLENVCRTLGLSELDCVTLEKFLPDICPPCQISEPTKRKRGPYQEFLSTCLKGKVKTFGQAGPALKECARQWREKKKGA
jgi:hypothetical protein